MRIRPCYWLLYSGLYIIYIYIYIYICWAETYSSMVSQIFLIFSVCRDLDMVLILIFWSTFMLGRFYNFDVSSEHKCRYFWVLNFDKSVVYSEQMGVCSVCVCVWMMLLSWNNHFIFEAVCGRSRYQGWGQTIGFHIICGIYLLVPAPDTLFICR